ncbi:MAG: VOC family protein [Propionicimonas sp.]|uniref:VOC family protein n=1 Tax=Propionicimonas sp. TaxID=1955623 RepID=UPI003D12167D
MTCRISHVTVDCDQPYELSLWWEQVLDYHADPDDPNEPDHEECLLLPPGGGQGVLFIKVPEAKAVKNRLHFDLRPTDRTRDEEIEHVLGLGATFIADHRGIHGPGTGWVVLADPEGNEFCILRSDAELTA